MNLVTRCFRREQRRSLRCTRESHVSAPSARCCSRYFHERDSALFWGSFMISNTEHTPSLTTTMLSGLGSNRSGQICTAKVSVPQSDTTTSAARHYALCCLVFKQTFGKSC